MRDILEGISAAISALMPLILWQLNRIHKLVNSALSSMTDRAVRSENALSNAGMQVPVAKIQEKE